MIELALAMEKYLPALVTPKSVPLGATARPVTPEEIDTEEGVVQVFVLLGNS